jgi:hypothetical protein
LGILSDEEYLQHTALLGSGYAALVQVRRLVESGRNLVVASRDVQVEIDMLDAYGITLSTVDESSTAFLLVTANTALNRHITDVSGQSLNDWLLINGLKVGQDYADLSTTLGVPIDPRNIA